MEHFIRHGNYLTHITVITDPVYLTEPLVKSQHFVLNPRRCRRATGSGRVEYVDRSRGPADGARCRTTCPARIRSSANS